MAQAADLLQGKLSFFILKTLAQGPIRGSGISQRIQQVSQEMLQVGQGSLYPALHRLEAKKLIRAESGASDNNRRAKYYSLSPLGIKQLEIEMQEWQLVSGAIALVLQKA